MKLIFLLIFLFVVACVFYGIYAGVSVIGRGAARMGRHQHHCTEPNTLTIQPLQTNTAMPTAQHRDYVAELQALFALHQSGALTLDEFARLKQRLFCRDPLKPM